MSQHSERSGSIYGYMRLAKFDQDPHVHKYREMLKAAGAKHLFEDRPTPVYRPQFHLMMHQAKRGDSIAVVRISHFSANRLTAASLLRILRDMGVNLITLDPPLNTGEPGGEKALDDLISELGGGIIIEDGGNGGGNGGGG